MRQLLAAGAAAGIGACDGWGIVCDPLPPPIECRAGLSSDQIFSQLSTDAQWLNSGEGWVATVSMSVFTARSSLVFSGDPQAVGATVAAVRRSEKSIAFQCIPETGVSQIALTLPMTCNGIGEELRVTLDVSATPAAGRHIPITPGR